MRVGKDSVQIKNHNLVAGGASRHKKKVGRRAFLGLLTRGVKEIKAQRKEGGWKIIFSSLALGGKRSES